MVGQALALALAMRMTQPATTVLAAMLSLPWTLVAIPLVMLPAMLSRR